MAARSRPSTNINIRPDEEFYGRIAALAKHERRSITNAVIWLLATHPLLAKPESKLNGHAHKVAHTQAIR
jgi:hypothetical protein